MYNNFTEDVKKVLIRAKEEMKALNHPYVGSEHLLLALLKFKNTVSDTLNKYDITYKNFKEEIIRVIGIGKIESSCFLYTPLLKRVIENAYLDSKENNNGLITLNHVIISLLEEGEGVAIRLLLGMDIDLEDLYHAFVKIPNIKKSKNKKLLVEEIGDNLIKKCSDMDPVIGRDEEVKQIIEILCRRKKNNPILIGEAGVGKTAIVENLSKLISIGKVPYKLRGKKIISLDVSQLVSGTKYRGEFEERVNKLLKECEENDDIILFIDEIHTLVGAGGAEGAIDASNIFKPALARNKLRCIGATTTLEYKKSIEEDKALDRRFQKVEIQEPNNAVLKEILYKLVSTYSAYHKISISNEMLDYIIELSNKYIHNRYQPDKSIDILDEVCAHVSLKQSKIEKKYYNILNKINELKKLKKDCIMNSLYDQATEYKREENILTDKLNKIELNKNNIKNEVKKDDIIEIVSRKCNVPIFQLEDYNSNEILKIEKNLKKTVIGHDKNIDKLMNVIKRIKLGFTDNNGCYCILFQGPSGVGKTFLAQQFGKSIFNNIIKLDMSEYTEAHSISKLIGSPAGYVGYNDSKNVFECVKDNPFSVIILDEIEKANSTVIDLLYQILEDGKVKDAKGEDIYFNNCIIIMTSNIGYLTKSIGFNSTNTKTELKEFFSIPFVNRIDSILEFKTLTEKDMLNIINNKLKQLKEKYKSVNIRISNETKKDILNLSNYNEYGARKIDKIIKNNIENIVIDKLLNNEYSVYIKNINNKCFS